MKISPRPLFIPFLRKPGLWAFLLFALGLWQEAGAQTDAFNPPRPGQWPANSGLFMGASFVRTREEDSVKVWLHGNEAGWTGRLYFLGRKAGGGDSLHRLFTNKEDRYKTERVNLSALFDIRLGDTVYFAYVVESGTTDSLSKLIKWTGPNQDPSKVYYSQASSTRYGHRWAVAGRMDPSTVVFGFEDNVGSSSDMDFDDIVFKVSGLSLNVEALAPPAFDPRSKTFVVQEEVRLSHPLPGVRIYYTTGTGTNPGAVRDPDSTATLYNPASPIRVTGSTVIKAIAYRSGYRPSPVAVEVYTKNGRPSTLTLLDQNGTPFPADARYLTERNPSFQVRLNTTQGGLASPAVTVKTRSKADSDSLPLSERGRDLQSGIEYGGSQNLSIGPGATAPGRADAHDFDLLVVEWRNPQNPADIARDSIPVRPYPKASQIYFSGTSGGAPLTSLTGNETQVFVVVEDQLPHPSRAPEYRVQLTTVPALGGQTPDAETFTLTHLGGGKFGVAVPLVAGQAGSPGNQQIQLFNGGQISASFKDPVDSDSARTQIGFGALTEVQARLLFTDSLFNPLPAGIFWNPATKKVYVKYTDDLAPGNDAVKSKPVNFTVQNGGGAASDKQTFTLSGPTGTGSEGTWTGIIPLNDTRFPTNDNGTLETYFLGIIRGTVSTHKSDGSPDGGSVSAELKVAYPNQATEISLKSGADTTQAPGRADKTLVGELREQSMSGGRDTLMATLTCSGTGDALEVRYVEVEGSPGVYRAVNIPKEEGASGSGSDAALTCRAEDRVTVRYRDPVYGDEKERSFPWSVPTLTDLYFGSPADTVRIRTLEEEASGRFFVIIEGASPSRDRIDSIPIVLTTLDGRDREEVMAVETAPFSQKFVAPVQYTFSPATPTPNNRLIEGLIDLTQPANRIVVIGRGSIGGTEDTDSLFINSGFNRVKQAYIKDGNRNGRGDTVVLEFDRELAAPPSSLPATYWNTVTEDHKRTAPVLSLDPARRNVLIADFSRQEFPEGLTSIPSGAAPYAELPRDRIFAGQRAPLADSMGPVVLSAVKIPPKNPYLPTGGFAPDTFIVTLSEPISPSSDLSKMIRFSSDNQYENSRLIIIQGLPTNPKGGTTEWVIIADPGLAKDGDKVFLNADEPITDMAGNRPAKRPAPLTARPGDLFIGGIVAFPPVVVSPKDPYYNLVNTESRKRGGYGRWVPPVGFNPSTYANDPSYTPPALGSGGACPMAIPPSGMGVQEFPPCLSAVQVQSKGRYKAKISIFDNLGNFLRKSEQHFGYCEEMKDPARNAPLGYYSYLLWDMKDENGRKAGQGAYVWKITFESEAGPEVKTLKTGIMRSTCTE